MKIFSGIFYSHYHYIDKYIFKNKFVSLFVVSYALFQSRVHVQADVLQLLIKCFVLIMSSSNMKRKESIDEMVAKRH
jgi:hypothetical protein